MRNLNECQAEVFRRSEKRIKERRQRRKHIAIACVPLVLCVTLASAFLWPEETVGGPGANESAAGVLQENRNESYTCSIAEISVTGSGFSRAFTDTSEVLQIWDGLSACQTSESQDSSNEIYGRPSYQGNTGRDSEDQEYTITLVMRYGEKIEYLLSGNTLKNLTEGQTHALTKKQTNTLYDLLGIPRRS